MQGTRAGARLRGESVVQFDYVEHNVHRVLERVTLAAARAGVTPPTVVAVTKSGTDEEVLALAGTRLISHLGENRTACLTARQQLLSDAGAAMTYHLVGSLQTNKVRQVTGRVDLIHSLDSIRLAEEIEKQSAKRGCVTSCLIEINSGREAAKGGVLPEEAEALLASVLALPHIRVRGLMTMAPPHLSPDEYRPYFALTRLLFEKLGQGGTFGDDPVLSMGMTDSFEVAIEEGATLVRIGRAFFENNQSPT